MSNKVFQCLKFFIGGLISGISISNSYLLPLIFLGHFFLIKGLLSRCILMYNFFPGWLFGFGFFLGSMHWIANPFLVYDEHVPFAPLVLFIFPLLMGLFFALPSMLITTIFNSEKIKDNFLTLTFFISFFLFLFEIIRSKIFGGLPLNLYAHIWSFDEKFIQIARLTGVYGLSFLTIFWVIITTLLFIKKKNSFLITLIFFPSFLLIFSNFDSKTNEHDNETLNVRVIQPNIDQQEKWDRTLFQKHIDKLIHLTLERKTDKELLVIWPEAALTVYLNENLDLLNYIRKNIDDNTTIVTGGLRRVFNGDNFRIFNSIFVIKKNSFYFYDKRKLVPFGEFIPLRSILNFWKLTPGKTDFSPGQGDNFLTLYKTKQITFEPSICYEAIFQTFNSKKVQLLINVTNDAWFGNTSGPKQHLNASIFRSVEKGIPLIRSANSGISVITDNKGKILKKIELNKSGFIETKVTLGDNSTIFMNHKNKAVMLLVLLLFISNLAIDLLIKKRKSLKIM